MPKTQFKKTLKRFTKHGKALKTYQDLEAITSLTSGEPLVTIAPQEQPTKNTIWRKPRILVTTVKQEFDAMRKSKVLVLPSLWLASNAALAMVILTLLFSNVAINKPKTNNVKYSIFSAKPLTLGTSTTQLFGSDTRAAVLDNVLAAYGCPLAGLGNVFVKEADRNDIPFWLAPAISFQESNCGRKSPRVDEQETYNAWGWNVWGTTTHAFDSWEDGIKTVSAYLDNKFFSRGITDPCEIMRVYTPSSNGSWCKGVNYFADIIQNYKTPEY